jgi:hypothetical protein
MLETFSLATFSDLLDDDFRVRVDDGASVELRLVEASGTGLPQQPGGREPFSLLFRGPGTPILPQRIYSVEHGALGAFDLFLVPLTPDAGGGRYEAVFA